MDVIDSNSVWYLDSSIGLSPLISLAMNPVIAYMVVVINKKETSWILRPPLVAYSSTIPYAVKEHNIPSAHEQAQTLKAELERVKSGLILLAQSMEKLQDSVRADSRCCGGVSEVCETTTSRTTTSRFRVGITGRRTAGYDRVDGGGGLYEDDYDDVSVNNRNGGRASSSVISPLGMAAVGRGGAAAGVGMRTGNAADAGKFTIESQDDDGDV
jgi:hypothetical protein